MVATRSSTSNAAEPNDRGVAAPAVAGAGRGNPAGVADAGAPVLGPPDRPAVRACAQAGDRDGQAPPSETTTADQAPQAVRPPRRQPPARGAGGGGGPLRAT